MLRWIASLLMAAPLLATSVALAEAPEILSHQGHLVLPDGVSAADGSYVVRFGVFATESGGLPLFERELSVRIAQGVYHVLLSGAPGELDDALRGTPRYLELTVLSGPSIAAPTVLSPRQQMGGVPFARFARTAAAADSVPSAGGSTTPALPTGAILLSADGSCPPGFEPLDGASAQGGSAHDMRGRFPLGADLGGSQSKVPDSVAAGGGTLSHRHSRGSAPTTLRWGSVTSGSTSSLPPYEHHHYSSSNDCNPDCWSHYTQTMSPFATVHFCRKT